MDRCWFHNQSPNALAPRALTRARARAAVGAMATLFPLHLFHTLLARSQRLRRGRLLSAGLRRDGYAALHG